MRNTWFPVLVAFAMLTLARSVLAAVVVNEVFFHPSDSSDTGLEAIELYNNGSAAIPMGGWELYPDGIGYFTFPAGFSISPASFVTIHLRASGAADAANLYYPDASSNMGNSSGSVALFSGEPRGKDTIVDFVRYQKPGSAERKTWESDAAKAGLWTAGEFVDISSLNAGSSIALREDGVRENAGSWVIGVLPTIGAANAGGGAAGGAAAGSDASLRGVIAAGDSATPKADAGRPLPPSLTVFAGNDVTALQGALVEFRASAAGIGGAPLSEGRFLWNFGDGTTAEGKDVLHTYYFPGTYQVSANVSSGEYAGADYLVAHVLRPDIFISEIKGGANGFVEIYNNTASRLDLGGFELRDGAARFAIVRGTFIGANTALVFPNAVTGLFQHLSSVELRDALDTVVDAVYNLQPLPIESSFVRVSSGAKKFTETNTPTPGSFSGMAADTAEAPSPAVSLRQPVVSAPPPQSVAADEKGIAEDAVASSGNGGAGASPPGTSGGGATMWLFGASLAVGILAAGGFLVLRLF